MFLNFFIRKAVYDQKVFELTTPSAYLEKHDTLQILSPSPSSWGNKGFWEVWLDESNSWIYPHLHAAARRVTECARAAKETPAEWKDRVRSIWEAVHRRPNLGTLRTFSFSRGGHGTSWIGNNDRNDRHILPVH